MNRNGAAWAWAAGLIAGCGGYTDPGTGSHTLTVQADLAYHLGNSTTAVDVTVETAGPVGVADATITVHDPDANTTTPVPYQPGPNGNAYHLALGGWHRRIELSISAPEGSLEAKIEGPGPHHIDAPQQGELLSYGGMGDNLLVEWATVDGLKADAVTVDLQDAQFSTTLSDDTGSTTIPKAKLAHALNQTETVRVTRQNHVALAGTIKGSGSTMTMSYEVGNDFSLLP
jgi:hypothetical protein